MEIKLSTAKMKVTKSVRLSTYKKGKISKVAFINSYEDFNPIDELFYLQFELDCILEKIRVKKIEVKQFKLKLTK